VPFVAQTIDSVIAQDYSHLEYIVVDGGSDDGTVDIIKARQSRISRWISERDSGISDAFNKGLALATGEYILFLNADDSLVNAGIVTDIANHIVCNNFPTIVYGDCAYLDRDTGATLHRIEVDFSKADLKRGRMPPHPAMFSKRSYFEKYGNFDVTFKVAMDFDWFLRGALVESIVHARLLVTNVRSGGVSAVNRDSAVNEILRAYRKNGQVSTRWAQMRAEGYFFARLLAKSILKGLGLYKLFDYLRNR
jgi:glycosyltransferase